MDTGRISASLSKEYEEAVQQRQSVFTTDQKARNDVFEEFLAKYDPSAVVIAAEAYRDAYPTMFSLFSDAVAANRAKGLSELEARVEAEYQLEVDYGCARSADIAVATREYHEQYPLLKSFY